MRAKSAISAAAPRADVQEWNRGSPLTRLFGARQHEEALGVPAHARREVIELEERAELVGLVDARLHVVEERDLPVEEALVPAGEVHVEVADPLLEQRRLLLRDRDRHLLHRAERLRELPDLVLGVDLDRRQLTELVGGELSPLVQRVDQAGEPALGHVAGRASQGAQRLAHAPDEHPGEDEDPAQEQCGAADDEEQLRADVGPLRRGRVPDDPADGTRARVEAGDLVAVPALVVRRRCGQRSRADHRSPRRLGSGSR